MQSAPVRLQQAIWTAFKASRPTYGSVTQNFHCSSRPLSQWPILSQKPRVPYPPSSLSQIRFYTDENRKDIEKKIENAQNKIDESLGSRAENKTPDETLLKKDETIIHTIPESSSIVHNPDSPGETAARGEPTTSKIQDITDAQPAPDAAQEQKSQSSSQPPPWHAQLPSQLRTQYSYVRQNFNTFMDNFQTHIFTASKRLNDLTGYSSIERLKQDIEDQEHAVRAARQLVKDSRSAYSDAIETRSATQREVNDLLHRKHAWSAGDLERFTSLYRSDHANEQDEQKAHSELASAEAAYEEASTKLSKSILARYHEEQVWSDKIRQMSTWGTWGLMGLNVLLFIVFQILVEPWRRRRLVRGFEDKVQEALKTNAEDRQLIANLQAEKSDLHQALQAEKSNAMPVAAVAVASDAAATPMSDSVVLDEQTTSDETIRTGTLPTAQPGDQTTQIEQAAEALVSAEILADSTSLVPPDPDSPVPETPLNMNASISDQSDPDSPITPAEESLGSPSIPILSALPSLSSAEYRDIPFLLGSYTRQYFDKAKGKVELLFDEKAQVSITRREMTSKILEGAFFGAIGAVTLFWVVGVGVAR